MTRRDPIRLVQALLARCLPPEYAADVLSELDQEYGTRGGSQRSSRWAARWWYLRQVIRFDTLRLIWLLRRRGPREHRGRVMARWVDGLRVDGRFVLKSLRKRWVGTLTVLGVLGVGIGTSTAIFGVVDSVLLRPAPYDEPARIVTMGFRIGPDFTIPWIFRDQASTWQERADFLKAFALYDHIQVTRTDGAAPERFQVIAATHDLDDLLGVRPVLGRAFAESDARAGERVAMLMHHYWQRLGGRHDVIGSKMRVDGDLFVVIGVLPDDFKFPLTSDAAAWLLIDDADRVGATEITRPSMVGRLRDGVTLDAAQQRADTLAATLTELEPTRYGWQLTLGAADGWRANPDVRRGLWMLSGAVLGLLLITLVNAVNLLVVQATARAREFRIRAALGASRRRMFRQLLTESVVIALGAGIVGVVVAVQMTRLLWDLYPEMLRWQSLYAFSLGPRGVAFGFLLAASAGLLVGLAPAIWASREGDRRHALGGYAIAGPNRHRLRQGLVAAGTAFSVILVVGAVMLAQNFARLAQVSVGLAVDELAIVRVALPADRYATPGDRARFYRELEARLEALPDVAAATVASGVFSGAFYGVGVQLQAEGREPAADGQPFLLPGANVDGDFLEVAGARLLQGRSLTSADRAQRGVIIDQPLARYLWPSGRALGQRFRTGSENDWYTVIGIVEDLRLRSPDDRSGAFDVLYALDEAAMADGIEILVRTTGAPGLAVPALGQVARSIDPMLPVEIVTARAELSDVLADPRFLLVVMATLGVVGTVLAAAGTYGALAVAVGQRRREMGIRLALGAARSAVKRQVLARGVRWAGIGILAGLLGAVLLRGLVESLLYEAVPGDASPFVLTAAGMLVVSVAACLIPAWRATQVDPLEIMRAE